ncbi:MAG: pyridoxamine 5'-phosphate oxidase [Spirochaetia bacterium]|nr:pyridoxamine 5'-phosphate oxidase [Spirochaetia bacterium]
MTISLEKNPIETLKEWLEDAKKLDIREPTAAALATADKNGIPSVRMVLVKDISEAGLVFYTNLESEKARQLKENAHASLCFYWMPSGRQVRISGKVSMVEDNEADRYFASREYMSRIGAWASKQSQPLTKKLELEKRAAFYTAKYRTKPPRPPFWSGFRVHPEKIEFWIEKPFRLHERALFTKEGEKWASVLLYP